ncbi:MAG: phosphoribosyltransferase family protein [Microcoleaceae cyanobacterium]
MSDLYVSWSEYHQLIESLATQIYQSQWEFDQIVCLARGGLRIGDLLSRIYDKPLGILSASSYVGEEGNIRGDLTIASCVTMTTETLTGQILLVDDLVDSGISLEQTVLWLKQHYPQIQQIKTAVLWYKACSVFKPDYYTTYLSNNPWIHQPFEKYEKMNLAETDKILDLA